MSSALLTESPQFSTHATSTARRLLVCGDAETYAFIEQQLSRTSYDLRTTTLDAAFAAATHHAPDIILVALSADAENIEAGLALARRLRGEAATYALPLVIVFQTDDATTRGAALALGADDYFAVASSRAEILARMDALLWRTAAGRRTAPTSHDQQAEIDDFMLLVDHARERINAGATGALVLIETKAEVVSDAATQRAETSVAQSLAKVYGYLKLNLRRVDSVAFYGPTTLLAYLPRVTYERAASETARLCSEFTAEHMRPHVAFGIASFPADGIEIEDLIERAEARLAADETEIDADQPHSPQHHAPSPAPVAIPPTVALPATAASPTTASLTIAAAPTPKPELVPLPLNSNVVLPISPVNGNGNNHTNGERANGNHVNGNHRQAAGTPAPALLKFSSPTTPHALDAAPSNAQLNRDKDAFSPAAADAAAKECELRAQGLPMPRRVLLTVSDPARLAQLNSLVRSAGYEVRTAFAGQQALDLLRIERPDVLLLDYELYETDGVETIRRLHRQERGRSSLPVVLLIGAEHTEARREADALGAHSIVTLPYQPAELLRCVRTAGAPG